MIAKRPHIRKWLAAFLLLIFGVYYTNVTLFYHTHIINGTTIVHSHCHSHQHHSTSDGGHLGVHVTLYAQLTSQLLMTAADMGVDWMAPFGLVARLGEQQSKEENCPILDGLYLRAPPVFVKTSLFL